ncbi:hypothetical protein M2404_001093 [Rheinheimera pacifica]|uniref:hypothetical protein n=1 Tax=Rheinheimera pacifica TaxID=173990 RepID=UPI0021681893|nr:hypothetical protein [Rheinheimera pacifica]MCS4306768.1 hypothetical protein [Rheinheimera pacifica]
MFPHKSNQRVVLLEKYIVFFDIFSCSAIAWDGEVYEKIQSIDVTGGGNYGFRVTLEGAPPICGNANTWGFLNDTDSNYQTYVSVLLAAKAAKMNVTIFTVRDVNGYCHVGHVSIN